jgi:dTDP-4-amino-4,6-dideoxygalactose transaminase
MFFILLHGYYVFMIPVMRPQIPAIDKVATLLSEMDSRNIYSNFGPIVKTLEREYAEYLGVEPDKVVSIANATLAIQGLCEVLPPLTWVIPDWTFVATAHAAISSRKKVLLADVSEFDYKLEIDSKAHLQGEAVGLIPVAPFGAKIDFTLWDNSKYIIYDAAASLGNSSGVLSGMPLKSSVVFSLHATKVLGAGEGAIVVCGTDSMAAELRSWSNFGFTDNRLADRTGTNAKMSEVSAAYALAALRNLEIESAEWFEPLNLSRQLMMQSEYVNCTNFFEGFNPYWIVQFNSAEQCKIAEASFAENGIQTRHWWPEPISKMSAFRQLEKLSENPNAQKLAHTTLGLPMWRKLPEIEVSRIANLLLSIR